ncbi:transglutaminase domain-containing protein [Bacillus sonorensis]|nr:transglutaminase domain-containing protein [Bacillus sonorensis]MCZ0070744.1 transglutaminase domain-containing protein [Bacillus sonorensis]MCZ0098179.1 transglutaminase domain-containing protein [Bacillus sonorensis]MEC1519705.1 transglutaminase domain-containing protein [Bacillus sonorensis]
MMSRERNSRVSLLIFYVLTFLLLWEWLRPLQYFTDTGHTVFFIVFIAMVFLFTFFKVPWMIRFPVSLGFILFALHWIFYDGPLLSASWVGKLLQEVNHNVSFIFSGMWRDMSPLFRTLLFFVLLWLLVYLLHYWVIYQRRIFFFFIMTIVYITVIDTFTPFDASYAIVRIAILGFLLLGMLYLERMKESERLKASASLFAKWFAPLLLLTAAAAAVGIAAPKTDPIWPDPVPFIKTAANGDFTSGGKNKVGYGTNDTSLGGPFTQDNTLVFTWQGKERSYFRVETKSHYTGKGWSEDEKAGATINLDDNKLDYQWYDKIVKTETRKVKVDINPAYRYDHVLYPIGTKAILLDDFVPLKMNSNTERMIPSGRMGADIQNLGSYSLTYESPVFDVNKLKSISMDSEGEWGKRHQKYLQLPASLPERVKQLALDLTKGHDNVYDKAKAIEDYLGSSDFSYQTKDVAVPSKNQDYVDQFLFETKIGYCDNFSTAMTVLLRSAGIPARWVKGYTSGQFAGTSPDKKQTVYEVTNNNAHSWVEVYFEGQGWVTFEPTKGFINPEQLIEHSGGGREDAASEKGGKEQEYADHQRKQAVKEEQKNSGNQRLDAQQDRQTDAAANRGGAGGVLWYGAAFLLLLLAAGAGLYFTRTIWLPVMIAARLKKRQDDAVFFKAYEELLRQLKRKGMKKEAGQTLREFAETVDKRYDSDEMTLLTLRYERALYRKEDAGKLWNESAELWENLIKRR